MSKTKGRKVFTHEERAEILAGAHGLGGKNLRQYLEEQGVSYQTYMRWKHERRLASQGGGESESELTNIIKEKKKTLIERLRELLRIADSM